MKSKIIRQATLLAVILFCFGSVGVALALTKPAAGITISLPKKDLIPFDIITIKSKSFDKNATAAVIFTIKSGQKITVPASSLTASTLKVQVPPVAYSEAKGAFTRQQVSLKVIQIKEQGEKLAVKTSNSLTGYYISAPLTPTFLKSAPFKQLPKGTLTHAFLIASVASLKSAAKNSLAIDSARLSASLATSTQGMQELLGKVSKVIKTPGAVVSLETTSGTAAGLFPSMLKQTDAFFAGYLGVLEKYHFLDKSKPLASDEIHLAQAGIPSECMQEAMGDPDISETEKEMLSNYVCTPIDSSKVVLPKAGVAIEMGMEVVWSTTALVESLEIATLGSSELLYKNTLELEGALMWAMHDDWLLSFHEHFVEPEIIFAQALKDNLFGSDFLTQLGYLADTTVETGKVLYNDFTDLNNTNVGMIAGIFAEPFYNLPNGFNPDVNLIKFNYGSPDSTSYLVRRFAVPPDFKSLILDSRGVLKGGFDVVPHGTVVTPISPPPPVKNCDQTKQDTFSSCLAGCGSQSTCYTDYNACNPSCTDPITKFINSSCLNGCLGALHKCTGANATCVTGCLNANNSTKCP